MSPLKLKYRTWGKGMPPRPVKLQIPGWSGVDRNRDNGAEAQPWHCMPFVEASTYGLEMLYPFDTEARITTENGRVKVEADFSKEFDPVPHDFPPFKQFAKGHYGFTSAMDLEPPEGHVIRLEPHPRFFTDATGECPILLTGHIQGEWWAKIFFVVFKSPRAGEVHVFRKHEPYGQMILVPRKITYDIVPFTHSEESARSLRDTLVNENTQLIAKHNFIDSEGQVFTDRYRQLATAFAKGGTDAVDALMIAKKKGLKPRLVKYREGMQDKEEGPEVSGLCTRSDSAAAQAHHSAAIDQGGPPTCPFA